MIDENEKPRIEIINQPCSNYRMRYASEKRSRNFLTAAEINKKQKNSYPKVKLLNIKQYTEGYLQIVCVCKTPASDLKYHVHPNQLVGKNCTEYGTCKIEVNKDTEFVELKELSIQHVLTQNIKDCLDKYKLNKIDPYEIGYDGKNFDLKCVKLCFQLILFTNDKKIIKSDPIVSNQIYNGTQNFIVERVFNACGSSHGGTDITALIKKSQFIADSNKNQIFVRFFDIHSWSTVVNIDFNHYGHTLIFKSPKYKNLDISEPVNVNFQILMRNDCHEFSSEAFKFTYEPVNYSTFKRSLYEDHFNDNDDFILQKKAKSYLLMQDRDPLINSVNNQNDINTQLDEIIKSSDNFISTFDPNKLEIILNNANE